MDLRIEYEELKNSISKCYHKDDELSNEIAEMIISTYIRSVSCDVVNLSFQDFYKKYLNGMLAFEARDFTVSQIREIISETPLTERDKNIAKLYYIELKSEEDIAYTLGIDKKTVRSNIPKISIKLKTTSVKLYAKC